MAFSTTQNLKINYISTMHTNATYGQVLPRSVSQIKSLFLARNILLTQSITELFL